MKSKKIICLLILLVCCSFYVFSNFQINQYASISPIKESYDNLKFTFFIDDMLALNIPEKGAGQVFDEEKSYCTDAEIKWDYEEWGPTIIGANKTKNKCFFYFKTQYSETLLNGTDPVLKGSLIPVTIAGDGTVTKADTGSEWYNYGNKQWANAVILNDESIFYNAGDVISESNIESYFVWIPRYRYQIFNTGEYEGVDETVKTSPTLNSTQIINIEFENKNQIPSNGTQVGEWLSHPAFRAFDVNGMWVGKFETGTTLTSDFNVRNGGAVQVKPNVESWRNIQVANAFYTSYDYKRELESHMMKNTEWGAVAYLTWSNYGLGLTDIRINSNSDYKTGHAAVNAPTCNYTGACESCHSCGITQAYNTATGYMASTAGNISGVYDMSGGTWEYVMGVMLDPDGNLVSGKNNDKNSNFVGTLTYPDDGSDTSKISWTASDGGVEWPDKRYYDTYSYTTHSFPTSSFKYYKRILGDATGELGPHEKVGYSSRYVSVLSSWYADEAFLTDAANPWLGRGGNYNYGLDAGLGAFSPDKGQANTWFGFRLVLSPQ